MSYYHFWESLTDDDYTKEQMKRTVKIVMQDLEHISLKRYEEIAREATPHISALYRLIGRATDLSKIDTQEGLG